jgi:hypothetical protein
MVDFVRCTNRQRNVNTQHQYLDLADNFFFHPVLFFLFFLFFLVSSTSVLVHYEGM